MAQRVAARYKSKKKDSEGNVHYEYSERQVQHRDRQKAEKVKKLESSIEKLRSDYKKKLSSPDSTEQLTALAVALIDETYERVGNKRSADEGHYGVTGWLVEHVSFRDGKAVISYTGKSGVDQKKEVSGATARALRNAIKGKSGSDHVFQTEEGTRITSRHVNGYLSDFDVTAKDLRGFHANREMRERLKQKRKQGPALPSDKKEREQVLKKEFLEALDEASDAVGHTSSILRSSYLVPGLEDDYMKDGTIKKATKSDSEKEQETVEKRTHNKKPKKKPPRRDLQNRRLDIEDEDVGGDVDSDKDKRDLSLNYKKVGMFSQSFLNIPARISGDGTVYYASTSTQNHLDGSGIETGVENMKRITKRAALQITADLDKLASLFQQDFGALGVDEDIAHDFAYRCDLLSDLIEKSAGIGREAAEPEAQSIPETDGWDPTQIGEQGAGALENDADEDYTAENFTSQEFRELRQKQEAGALPGVDPRTAQLKKKLKDAESKVALSLGGLSDEEAYSYAEELALLETGVKTCESEIRALSSLVSEYRSNMTGDAQKGMDSFLTKLPSLLSKQGASLLSLRDAVLAHSASSVTGDLSEMDSADKIRLAMSNVRDALSRQKEKILPIVKNLKASAQSGSMMDILEKAQLFSRALSDDLVSFVGLVTEVVDFSEKSAGKAQKEEAKAESKKKASDDSDEEAGAEEKEDEGAEKKASARTHGYDLFS